MIKMTFCSKCGTKLRSNSNFCTGCGKQIKTESNKKIHYLELIKKIPLLYELTLIIINSVGFIWYLNSSGFSWGFDFQRFVLIMLISNLIMLIYFYRKKQINYARVLPLCSLIMFMFLLFIRVFDSLKSNLVIILYGSYSIFVLGYGLYDIFKYKKMLLN